MIKILISCGAGMSSSFLTQKLQAACEEKGWSDRYSFDFYPLEAAQVDAPKVVEQYDIVMACPHLRLFVKKLCENNDLHTPIYILPPQMYGTMILEEVVTDAEDVIAGFKEDHMNPWHFPGEDQPLKIRRKTAYRNTNK